MGSWFGGRLQLQGNTVQLLTTNRRHRQAITENGLVMRSRDSQEIVPIVAVSPNQISTPVELIILFTKTHQSAAALEMVSSAIGTDTHVLTLQNGLGNADIVTKYVSEERVLIGLSMMPVDMLSPGVVESKGQGSSYFGPVSGAAAMADKINAAFAATDLDVQLDTNVNGRIWEKVAFNAGMNALCALCRGTPGTINLSPGARSLVKSVAQEVVLLAESQGVVVELERVYNTIDYACSNHPDHKASMLQDLLGGRPTEVDALNGAVCALAAKTDVSVPLNSVLLTLIKLAEQSQCSSLN